MRRASILVLLAAIAISGCGEAAQSNNASVRPVNTSATRTPSSAHTANSMNTSVNSYRPSANSNSIAIRPPTSEREPPARPPAEPTPVRPSGEKRDEGLFSFPPPRVTGYASIEPNDLMNSAGQTDFSYVANRLAEALRRAGYPEARYKFFWNDRDEFAIVTAMERVNKDGSPVGVLSDGAATNEIERWNSNKTLPRAGGLEDYFQYLFSGKRVFYRVFAFVVTPRRYRRNFYSNSPPDFNMAVNWMAKGESQLGDGGPGSIEYVPFTNEYSCYALLYLFVNHTSLDAPKSVDALSDKNEMELKEGLDLMTENHLNRSRITFSQ